MARAVKKYLLAAVIALLAMQGATASVQVLTPSSIVCRAEVRQQKVREARTVAPVFHDPAEPLPYLSHVKSQPDSAPLFQRPPPATCLIS
jgi:hypothetical protein